ncbi:nadh:flavin oxidoreductase nadh oxidase [Fusarium heterosporum]|uniref:Nadh:flavin oxidoreductase nadh oxidase n=1 Tax=Fusarium heterosporum TaxID=42747 RepID=A0A8H5WN05_FUSHE|nr:nadh:flavin oxidoreductase nadh oxidase [Fusarium heterosporum]
MSGLIIEEPLVLRCGLKLPNRLVKASMSENISTIQSLPDAKIRNVYRSWAKGGWGMLITGNVQVDDRYLGTSTDLALDSTLSDEAVAASWSMWAQECSRYGTPAIMQLNHPGRQCPIGAGKHGLLAKNLAPSALGLHMGTGFMATAVSKLAFGVPREIDEQEIQLIIDKFSRASALAVRSGFGGVEIHASHGYLLDQFLSPQTNLRSDNYGGSSIGRAKLTIDIIHAIRQLLPAESCIGILVGGPEDSGNQSAIEDRLQQLDAMVNAGVDYLHISGGTFEKPAMFLGTSLGQDNDKTGKMQPYFKDFSKIVKSRFPAVPVIVTGGFRDRMSIETAIASGASDMVGIARPAAVSPCLPTSTMLNSDVEDNDATFMHPKVDAPWVVRQVGVTALNVHMDNAWYLSHVCKMSKLDG